MGLELPGRSFAGGYETTLGVTEANLRSAIVSSILHYFSKTQIITGGLHQTDKIPMFGRVHFHLTLLLNLASSG